MQRLRRIEAVDLFDLRSGWLAGLRNKFLGHAKYDGPSLAQIKKSVGRFLDSHKDEAHTIDLAPWDKSPEPQALYHQQRAPIVQGLSRHAAIFAAATAIVLAVLFLSLVVIEVELKPRAEATFSSAVAVSGASAKKVLPVATVIAGSGALIIVLLAVFDFFQLHGIKKRALQPRARDILDLDRRLPVLLIRSFLDDDAPIVTARQTLIGDSKNAFDHTRYVQSRFEEALAPQLKKIGPLVAVGNPRDTLPDFGAARARFSDEDWKKPVLEMIEQARLVVLVCGPAKLPPEAQLELLQHGDPFAALNLTPGVKWEVEHIMQTGLSKKLLILLKPHAMSELPFSIRHGTLLTLGFSMFFDVSKRLVGPWFAAAYLIGSVAYAALCSWFGRASVSTIKLGDMVAMHLDGRDAENERVLLVRAPQTLHSKEDYEHAVVVAFHEMFVKETPAPQTASAARAA